MAYRSGTYVAFDGQGKADPTKSDFKYFATLKAWNANNNIDFEITDSHEKTDAVRDTSKKITLQTRIQKRLRNSKNMVVILNSDTRKSGSMLSYEIEQAVDVYKIPLIVVYVDKKIVQDVKTLSSYWPDALRQRINNSTAKAIHIPLKKDPILSAIRQFSINDKMPNGSMIVYIEDAYRRWGLL